MCNNLRLIPLDEMQTVFGLSPSLFSQPCRFRRAVKSASFPPGEAKETLRIRPKFHKTAGTYRETPLRLAKSRLAAVARLHGACGRTSQPLRAASSALHETAVRRPLVGYTC